MPIPLVNSIASWFLKKRFHQMELFLKYPHDVQTELLSNLLNLAKNTEYGKQYDFSSIKNYKDFANRLPVTCYEEYEPLITKSKAGVSNVYWPTPINWFAKSSGTTNAKSKFIPVSQESLEDCHYAAGKDLLCIYLNNNENSKLFTGKSLRLGGSKKLQKQHNIAVGDLSAIIIDNMPFWAEFSSTPSNEISLMDNWELKMKAIVQETIYENVTSLAGVPSWMLVLLNEVLETTGYVNLSQIWNNLEVYFHGGVNFEPYRDQYNKIVPATNFNYYEIYNASEGFFAIQDRNDSNELLLMLDYGIFYEFIPMESYHSEHPKVIPLNEVEIGKNYAIVITTNAGLWRYKIGDTVRFTSTNPYRIKVTGRTKHFINAFGEEVIVENVEEALHRTTKDTHCQIIDYTVAPVFMEGNEKGAHEWMIEFKTEPADLSTFEKALDQHLRSVNSDYDAKRTHNITLNQLRIIKARPKLFYDWLKKNDKLGGQHKIPRLSNHRRYMDELIQINESSPRYISKSDVLR